MNPTEDWWATPKRRLSEIPKIITLDNKIDYFCERINGWKIDIADHLINGKIIQIENGFFQMPGEPQADYATLDIILSYFEMIAKYSDGYVGEESAEYFKKGIRMVFPNASQIEEKELKSLLDDLLSILYGGARCGAYHAGFPDSNILLAHGETEPIVFHANRRVTINPQKLVLEIRKHFNDYIKQLKDTKNTTLRKNFERRFDMDTSTGKKRYQKTSQKDIRFSNVHSAETIS